VPDRSIHALPPTFLISILILSSHLRLGFPSGLIPIGSHTKTLHAPLPHTSYMLYPSQFSWFNQSSIWWGVQSMKLLVMSYSALPCYLVPLGSKYPPQHSILENPQLTFLSSMWVTNFHNHTKQHARL
jgi:hypothetical protein